MQTDITITAKEGMIRGYHYVVKIPDHIVERIKELETTMVGEDIDHDAFMLADELRNHWCAYVAVPKTNIMFGMNYYPFQDLSVGKPDVTDLNYSNHLKGYSEDNWYFGWDYNHSYNTEAPLESTVMSDINSCIDWIEEASQAFKENKVWHDQCPCCRSKYYTDLP